MKNHNKPKKSLSLQTQTVRALQEAKLQDIVGGMPWTWTRDLYHCTPRCPV
jgi:hypothetical protein